MDKEIWKDIVGYEGKYAVSNWGRVKSLYNGRHKKFREKILSPGKHGNGYLFVNLYRNGEQKKYWVHRLILMTFNPVENMENLDCNHLDENKLNNRLENLEWCTHEENCNHGTRNKRAAEKKSIPIAQLALDGKLVNVYKSSMAAEREGGFTQQNINACCKGKLKTHGGYRFMYLSEYMDKYCGIIE